MLLVVTLALSALPAIAVFVWLPNPPPPPSLSDGGASRAVLLLPDDGAASFYYDGEGAGAAGASAAAAAGCGQAGAVALEAAAGLRSASFCLVALSGGSTMAVWGAWSGVLPTVMTPHFSADQAGAVGSVATFASIAGK